VATEILYKFIKEKLVGELGGDVLPPEKNI
jgi:hypothetical protein